jgi:transposase
MIEAMKLTMGEYLKIKDSLPVQRGNVVYENLDFLNALLYVIENGCKWRSLPEQYGNWNSIYQRARRWANNGVMEKVFLALQREQIICIKIEHASLDSTSIKAHPDAHGALKKEESNASENRVEDGTQNFMWLPRMTK